MVLVLLAATPALAQDRNVPTGGRSVLMGNTGIALGRDGSAPFLNPATIGEIDDTKLAFAVNLYKLSFTTFDNFYQPRTPLTAPFDGLNLDSQNYVDTQFEVLPSTLCIFFTLRDTFEPKDAASRAGRQKAAICFGQTLVDDFVLTASSIRGHSPSLTTLQAISSTEHLRKASIGPTYGVYLTDSLALGASLHGTLTSRRTQWRATSLTADPQNKAIGTTLLDDATGTSFDVTGILGATYRASPVTVGLAIALPAIHVYGTSRLSSSSQVTGTGATDNTQAVDATGSFSATPPMRIDIGAGIATGRTILEGDLGLSLPWPQVYSTALHGTSSEVTNGQIATKPFDQTFIAPGRAAISGGVGVEYKFTPAFGIVGGASADISLAPGDTVSITAFHDYPSRQNRIAASLGVGSYGAGSELMLGAEVSYGFGKRFAPDIYSTNPTFGIVDTRTTSVLFVVSGATNFQTIKKAIDGVKDAVKAAVTPDALKSDPPKTDPPKTDPPKTDPPK